MKENELRIGNLIADYECEPYYFEVEQIRKYVGYENWIFYRNGSVKTKLPEPIPLTEEWLLRFGFENGSIKMPNDQYFEVKIKDSDFYIGGWDACTSGHMYSGEIKHVHQLQNLYFALTNTELIWNGEK